MSLLRRIEKPGPRERILRHLLEKLAASDELKPKVEALLEAILTDEKIELSEEEQERLRENPVEYLLGGRGQSGSSTLTPEQRQPMLRRQSIARPEATGHVDRERRLIKSLTAKVLEGLDDPRDMEAIRTRIEALFLESGSAEEPIVLSRAERQRLFEAILANIIGFGPLEPLLNDDTVTEIFIHNPQNIWAVRTGALRRLDLEMDEEEAQVITNRLFALQGQHLDASSPIGNARIPHGDGFLRVSAAIPPVAVNGTTATIVKYTRRLLTLQDLIRFGALTPELVEFLRACVVARLNIVVSGGGRSGKTTLLNALAGFVPHDERILAIEQSVELELAQEQVIRLESRPPDVKGEGEVTMRDLVAQVNSMHPERLIVGELRGEETMYVLRLMTMGYDGTMTAFHSNSPRDTLHGLETKCLMSGSELPQRAIREQIASSVDLIVHLDRLRDGSRKIVYIGEVQGMEGEKAVLSDIFEFEQTGFEGGKVMGHIRPTGVRPKCIDRIEDAGIHLPPEVFGITPRR